MDRIDWQEMGEIYRALNIPISIFYQRELLRTFSRENDFNLPMILMSGMPDILPVIWTCRTEQNLTAAGCSLPDGKVIFLGPVLPYFCSQTRGRALASSFGRKPYEYPPFIHYLNAHEHLMESRMAACARLLYRVVTGEKAPDPESVLYRRDTGLPLSSITFALEPGRLDQNMEKQMLSCVRHGNVREVDHILAGIDSGSDQTREELSINSAYIIAAITLASRAAVMGGMDYGYAMAEQERYLERIRTAREPEEHALIFIDAFHNFTEQIARIRQNEAASPIGRHVSGYIQGHLYEKITPQQIADALHINRSYLCSSYKAHTGKTISYAIHSAKAEEAMRLMESGNDSILQISELLCYSSSSYFCSCFEKVTGMRPGQYRKKEDMAVETAARR